MNRFARAATAFIALPGVLVIAVPIGLSIIDPWSNARWPGRWSGLGVVAAGLVILLWCVRDFYRAGKGTLAPWSPPERLVTVGLYTIVRNPMYVGALITSTGWALTHASPIIGAYTLILALAFDLRVRRYEEPGLAREFPTEWQRYRTMVRRWIPSIRR